MHTFNPSTGETGRRISEFKACVVCRSSEDRLQRYTEKPRLNPHLQKEKKRGERRKINLVKMFTFTKQW